jgi:hypothetical protein
MAKTIQQMKRVILNYPEKPKETDAACCDTNGDLDPDMFKMAIFVWKENYKSMKSRMDRYKGIESNAWALICNQCYRTEEQAQRNARLHTTQQRVGTT